MNTTKRLAKASLLLFLVLVLVFQLAGGALAATVDGKYVAGAGLYVMDFETGLELYSQNPDQRYIPASVTKLMSLYVIFGAIENGEISYDTTVPVSANVYRLSRDSSFWNTAPLYYNQTYTVGELIDLIAVHSASASVVALAELLCGSESAFVKRMNETAAAMGWDANFVGCSGIQDNQITPRSVALLARELLTRYPQILDSTSKLSVNFHGVTYGTTNHLLYGASYYQGADGLKTGTTTNAWYCFVGTAMRNGVRIITVVMRSTSDAQRYNDTRALLDYGFKVRGQTVHDETLRVGQFRDVYADDWFAESVQGVVSGGLMNGVSEDMFSPNTPMSRAMAVTVVYRALGSPDVSELSNPYADVPDSAWYIDSVKWALNSGLAIGATDDHFFPSAPVARQDLAVVLDRCAGMVGIKFPAVREYTAFKDEASIAWYALTPVKKFYEAGIINGKSGGKFDPNGLATRAEVAAILWRFMLASAELNS